MNRFFYKVLMVGATFLALTSCRVQSKAVTYSKKLNKTEKKALEKDSITERDSIRATYFYQYDPANNWHKIDQLVASEKAYKLGKIREYTIFPNEKIENPTPTQTYLQNMTDTLQESNIGKNVVLIAEKENVVVHADTTDQSNSGIYSHDNKSISHSLVAMNDPERQKKVGLKLIKALHITTLLEEYIHAKDFITNGIAIDKDNDVKLTPTSMMLRNYSFEAAAKTNVIIAMHQLKEKGHEELWNNAQKIQSNASGELNIIGRMMGYYDDNIDQNSTQKERLDAASNIYKLILANPSFRSKYFELGLNSIEYNQTSTFREITQDELERAGNIPGTPDSFNFIKNAFDKNILGPEINEYAPWQKNALEKKQKEIREENSNFTPNTFTENDRGGYEAIQKPAPKRLKFGGAKN